AVLVVKGGKFTCIVLTKQSYWVVCCIFLYSWELIDAAYCGQRIWVLAGKLRVGDQTSKYLEGFEKESDRQLPVCCEDCVEQHRFKMNISEYKTFGHQFTHWQKDMYIHNLDTYTHMSERAFTYRGIKYITNADTRLTRSR
ncbi:hypothetical protein Bpfe_009828, partial [Biomphalaria pfeifferi]